MITYRNPLKLCANRVWRTYTGGRLIEEWQHLEKPADGCFPEEWVASVTRANNSGRESAADEGLSYVETDDGGKIALARLIESDPASFLGPEHVVKHGNQTAVLIKMLDSAERLTIQVHPDRSAAKTMFQSKFGKTEAWYILGGRQISSQSPYVLLGFKPGMTREKWVNIFQNQDIEEMLRSLHRFPVYPGQVFLIEGGVPHAIGPGCFLMEIQEPTDYTIRVERKTPSGLRVTDMLCHQGLGFDKMFDCFHYDGYTEEEVRRRWILEPKVLSQTATVIEKRLIGSENTLYFGMTETEVFTAHSIEKSAIFSVMVVVSGNGVMRWEDGELQVRQGGEFFIPAGVGELYLENSSPEPLRLIRCFPPL